MSFRGPAVEEHEGRGALPLALVAVVVRRCDAKKIDPTLVLTFRGQG